MASRALSRMSMNPNRCYPMNEEDLGWALIINNVKNEFEESMRDVEALSDVYKDMGFKVRVQTDCNQLQMIKIKEWLTSEDTHTNSNCVLVTVISHGTEKGWLLSADRKKGWVLEDLVLELGWVNSLKGKPKMLIIQACRGTLWSSAERPRCATWSSAEPPRCATLSALPELTPDFSVPHPDRADVFIGFATAHGYRAVMGEEDGSFYLQCLARGLQEMYLTETFQDIHLLVMRNMSKFEQGIDKLCQASEERSSLLYKVKFSEYKKIGDLLAQRQKKTMDMEVKKLSWATKAIQKFKRKRKEQGKEQKSAKADVKKLTNNESN